MKISTCGLPPMGAQDLGIIYGVCCMSTNFFRDTAASFRNITIGGELTGYADMIQQGLSITQSRLEEAAKKRG